MLETFVAISGFLFCYAQQKHGTNPLKSIVTAKIKRLYIPCLIWGIVYYLLFIPSYHYTGIYKILNGIGHLWFLPMLFWCFILEKAIVLKYLHGNALIVLSLIAVLPYPTLPFWLNTSLYYLFYFHLGYLFCLHKDRFLKILSMKRIVLLILFTVPIFVFATIYRNDIDFVSNTIYIKALKISFCTTLRFIYSVPVVILYFFVGNKLASLSRYSIFSTIATYSFGIYLIQEFILRVLYYKLDISQWIYAPLIPVFGFIFAFLLSLGIAMIMHKSLLLRKIV